MEVVYFGGDPRKRQQGCKEVRQGRKDGQYQMCSKMCYQADSSCVPWELKLCKDSLGITWDPNLRVTGVRELGMCTPRSRLCLRPIPGSLSLALLTCHVSGQVGAGGNYWPLEVTENMRIKDVTGACPHLQHTTPLLTHRKF